MAVQVLKYLNNFSDVKNFDLMAETVVVVSNEISETASFAVLNNEKEHVSVLKGKVQLNNSRVFNLG